MRLSLTARFLLKEPGPFREVEFGWDPTTCAFFLECFERTAADSPTIRLRELHDVDELLSAMAQLHLSVPAEVSRYLLTSDLESRTSLPVANDPLWQHVY